MLQVVARSAGPLVNSPEADHPTDEAAATRVAADTASAKRALCIQPPAPAAVKRPPCPSSHARIVLCTVAIAISHARPSVRIVAVHAGKHATLASRKMQRPL